MMKLNRSETGLTNKPPERFLQFGGGNFLRAFVDWMIDHLNKHTDFSGSVVVVKPTEGGSYQSLQEQDGLFHVILTGISKGQTLAEKTLVECVSRSIHPYLHWDEYLSLAEQEEIRYIVSNTTEAGISFVETDQMEDAPPSSFPAKLTIWLHHRYRHFGGDPEKGCILFPCELIEDNGDQLRHMILQYAEQWSLEKGFHEWIKQHNIFCNTLVDRIVSGYPKEAAADLQKELGYEDRLLVAGEYYHSWVIQGPAWIRKALHLEKTDLNVQFVDDLRPHRMIKVRMLNGAHTAMVPLAYLSGMRTVREAIEEANIGSFIEQMLYQEVLPTLDFPESEMRKFAQSVLDRFRNPSIQHQLISISLNSTSKFRTRLLPSLLEFQKRKGKLPPRIVLAFAALIIFYKGNWEGESIPLQDDPQRLRFFRELWEKAAVAPEGLVQKVLGKEDWWGQNLNNIPELTAILSRNVRQIGQLGMYKTLLQIQ